MQTIHTELETLLKKDKRLIADGKLMKNKVIEFALKLDKELLKLLKDNKSVKNHFFQEVDSVLVFDKVKFQDFVNLKSFLADSYTKYKSKIGLEADGDYLSKNKDVVLVWPYKDCLLEGGQTKAERENRSEIFWNETLAPEHYDRLLSPKAFTNFKKYDSKGEHDLKGKVDFGKENLIVKGNNLLALYSLKERFEGKVKLIYIDPPYNTGGDDFGYNDNFNHSTWLTFMKNRLEIAKDFLTDDGVIFVHCDNNEHGYLKIIMDEIFDRDNFIETITVVNNPRGRDYGGVANMHEFMLVYANTHNYEMYPLYDENKEFPFKDKLGGFEIRELRNRNTKFNIDNRRNLCYPFYINPKKKDENGFLEILLDEKKGWVELLPAKSQGIQTVWRWGKEKSQENLNINICGKEMEKGGYQIVEKYREKSRLARSVWWDKEVNSERGTVHLRELFNGKVFNHPKPETLMKRIIEISTKENDLIMDYHLGSGTTATTAHKMNRKYIGIEQMNYIDNVTVERLNKVINNERGGISEEVNWKGGGSFIYCELAKDNAQFIDKIEKAKKTDELKKIWAEMQKEGFISHRIKETEVFSDDGEIKWKDLSVDEQKQILIRTLDLNHLYINYSEMEDERYKKTMDDETKKLNKQFYSAK